MPPMDALSVADLTGLIGVGRRQIYRVARSVPRGGPDGGLISRKRGGSSNRARGAVCRNTVLAIVRERYADFWSGHHTHDAGLRRTLWKITSGRNR